MRTDFFSHRNVTIDVTPTRIPSPGSESRVNTQTVRAVSAITPVMRDLPQPRPDSNLPHPGQRAQSGYSQVGAMDDQAPKIMGFDAWV